jgi:hypothetical protein
MRTEQKGVQAMTGQSVYPNKEHARYNYTEFR